VKDCVDSFDGFVECSLLFDVFNDHVFKVVGFVDDVFLEPFSLLLGSYGSSNFESSLDELLCDVCVQVEIGQYRVSGGDYDAIPKERERLTSGEETGSTGE
jgi:hypothetical protein